MSSRPRSAAREGPNVSWAEKTVVTPLGRALGLHTENQQFRLYRATLDAIVNGMVLGRGRHGVVMALSNDPADPKFRLAVKIVHKYFTPSKGKEPSFHRAVAHTLHLQNEVAAMAKLSAENTFLLPLYCAFQDDLYVYIVCERGCCTLKQLIQHSHEDELQQLLAFQQAQPLKFISFCMLMSLSMMHACWSMQNGRLIHHDIHPAQILVTADGRPRLSDLGQCSVIGADGRKQLLPPLGRRDFCRPAKLGPLQGSEVDGYGCGATLWVTWKGSYDQIKKVEREWNKHEERELLQEKLEQLATKAIQAPPPRWAFAALVRRPAPLAACAQMPPSYPRPRRVRATLTPCCRLVCAGAEAHRAINAQGLRRDGARHHRGAGDGLQGRLSQQPAVHLHRGRVLREAAPLPHPVPRAGIGR